MQHVNMKQVWNECWKSAGMGVQWPRACKVLWSHVKWFEVVRRHAKWFERCSWGLKRVVEAHGCMLGMWEGVPSNDAGYQFTDLHAMSTIWYSKQCNSSLTGYYSRYYIYDENVRQHPPNLYHLIHCMCLIGHIIWYSVACLCVDRTTPHHKSDIPSWDYMAMPILFYVLHRSATQRF